jgi:hypothetical protein
MRKKLCLSCNTLKSLWTFRVNTTQKDRRHFVCFNCLPKRENLQYFKKYYRLNKEKIKMYRIKKYNSDINFKILCTLRTRLTKALNSDKINNTLVLLGCSIKELKLHLEKTFKNGMNWENYGKEWHIDHVLPCASFDLKIPENQEKCFHFSNLQALWAKENLQKSDKLNYFSNLS